MTRWLDLLAAPMIWALHFGLVYGIASVSLQSAGVVTSESRIAIAVTSIVLAALVAAISFWPRRALSGASFFATIRTSGGVIALVAIAWQSLPLILR